MINKLHLSRIRVSIAIAAILIIAGLVGVIPTLYFIHQDHGTVAIPANSNQIITHLKSASAATVTTTPIVSGVPVAISITDVHSINLPVVNGYFNSATQTWNVSDTTAQYATASVPVNNTAGNTLIYGHYRKSVFEYLHLITPGSLATVTTSNGYIFTYRFVDTYATQPTDTTVFTYKGAPELTVQTCSGEWYQNRQMFQFAYVSYQKA